MQVPGVVKIRSKDHGIRVRDRVLCHQIHEASKINTTLTDEEWVNFTRVMCILEVVPLGRCPQAYEAACS